MGVKVILYDLHYVKVDETITDLEGKYNFGPVDCETKYRLKAEIAEYTPNEITVLTLKTPELLLQV